MLNMKWFLSLCFFSLFWFSLSVSKWKWKWKWIWFVSVELFNWMFFIVLDELYGRKVFCCESQIKLEYAILVHDRFIWKLERNRKITNCRTNNAIRTSIFIMQFNAFHNFLKISILSICQPVFQRAAFLFLIQHFQAVAVLLCCPLHLFQPIRYPWLNFYYDMQLTVCNKNGSTITALFPSFLLFPYFLCNFKILQVRHAHEHRIYFASHRLKQNLSLKLMIFRFFHLPWHLFLVLFPLPFVPTRVTKPNKLHSTLEFCRSVCSFSAFQSNNSVAYNMCCLLLLWFGKKSYIIKHFPLFYTFLFRKCIYILFGYPVLCAVHCYAHNSFQFVMSTYKRRKFVEIFIKLVFTFAPSIKATSFLSLIWIDFLPHSSYCSFHFLPPPP